MTVPLMFQPLVKYAQFEGRSRRSEFWLWVLFRLIVGLALGAFAACLLVPFFSQLAAHPHMDDERAISLIANIFYIYPVYMLVGVGLLLPTIAVAVRRLHDINRSGLWLLMPLAVAFGGLIILVIAGVILAVSAGVAGAHQNAQTAAGEGAGAVVGIFLFYGVYVLAIVASEIIMLVFFVTEGTKGPNRFGEDPKAVTTAGATVAAPV